MVTALPRIAVLCAWLGAGCGLQAPLVGDVVRPGVAKAIFEQRVRHTDLIEVHVYFPADARGAVQGSQLPAAMFIQGGLVAPARYSWLAEALAARGFVVALPDHLNDLAIFAIDNGHFARRLLADPPVPSLLEGAVDAGQIAVLGHSLGGVVATKLGSRAGEFAAVALLASFPDGQDGARLPDGTPTLSLAGASDCSAPLEKVTAGSETLASPTALVVLAGVTHFQFTNTDERDFQRDCPPQLDLASAHQRIEQTLAAFLTSAVREKRIDASALQAVEGAEVRTR